METALLKGITYQNLASVLPCQPVLSLGPKPPHLHPLVAFPDS